MLEATSPFLTSWSNFYIMTGSAAAALTGLMFVVITLVSGEERTDQSSDGTSTFSTPTVVHFGAALLLSAVFSAPWHVLTYLAVILVLVGVAGIVYGLRQLSRAKHLTVYRPDFEDWTWYTALPFVAYGAILASGLILSSIPITAMFVAAAGVLLLIFIGIHNAWDIVTYLAVGRRSGPPNN